MKRSLATALVLVLLSGCTGSPEAPSQMQTMGVLSATSFNQIKDYILAHGDRQTYCNMFNNNPHIALDSMDIYLNPDTGQQNIDCDPKLSAFNYMVIRTLKPYKYYRVQLNLRATGPDLLVGKNTNRDQLKKRFQQALSEIGKKRRRTQQKGPANE